MNTGFVLTMLVLPVVIIMVAIGVYTMKFSSKGVNAFFIGDRKLSNYVVSLKAGLIAELVPGFFGGLFVRPRPAPEPCSFDPLRMTVPGLA